MQNLLDDLKELLQQDERLVADGKLLKNKIIELGLQLDPSLLKILLSSPIIHKHFFTEVENVFVFDKIKFQKFVSNKAFLADSYTSFKNKIGLTVEDEFISECKEVALAWPYKDCILEGGQTKEDAKRNEIFWNELLAPDEIDRLLDSKVLDNFKKFDKDGEHDVVDISMQDNFIIKGNNLLALHSLKKTYAGKVKLIYIDPPYNIGNDSFQYNDSFNHSTWLTFMRNRLEVARDLLTDDGSIFVQINYKEVAYLTVLLDQIFGRNNLIQLISVKTASPAGFKTVNPGPIDVTEYLLFYTKNKSQFKFKRGYVPTSYDDNYSKVITNIDSEPTEWILESLSDVVCRDNGIEIGTTWQKTNKNAEFKWGPYWKIIREQLKAAYALDNAHKVVSIRDPHKPTEKLKKLLSKSKTETDKVFLYKKSGKEGVEEEINNSKFTYVINGGALSFYSNKVKNIDGKLTPTELLTNFWRDVSWDGIAKEGNVKLKNGKKPEKLLKRIIEIATDNSDDVVLDFHLGSGTTCAVAHKMGRRYIGIEQLDYDENDSVFRLKNVISGEQSGVSKYVNWKDGGSFIYCELAKANLTFIDQIQEVTDEMQLKAIFEAIKEKSFLSYKIDLKQIAENANDFDHLSFLDKKRFLIEILDKNMFYIPYSEIEDETFSVSKEAKALNQKFYNLK